MVQGTNEGLASHITKNPIAIHSKKQDWNHIENSLKTSLKLDDDGISRIGVDDAVDSRAQKAKSVTPTHLCLVIFNLHWNPSLHWRFRQKVLNKP